MRQTGKWVRPGETALVFAIAAPGSRIPADPCPVAPGTRLRSDNQAASARLVETAGLEPATSTFSIILRLRPLTGQVCGEGTAQCSSELSYVSELDSVPQASRCAWAVFKAVTQALRPVRGGGGCRDSNPDLALNRR